MNNDVKMVCDPKVALDLRDHYIHLCQDKSLRHLLCERCLDSRASRSDTSLMAFMLSSIYKYSTCVLWDWEVWRSATTGSDAFTDTLWNEHYTPDGVQMWFLPRPQRVTDSLAECLTLPTERQLIIDHLLIVPGHWWQSQCPDTAASTGYFVGMAFATSFQAISTLNDVAILPYWRFLKGPQSGIPIEDGMSEIAALVAFMAQPYCELQAAPMSRQQKRLYQRKNGMSPPVRIVAVRKRERKVLSTDKMIDWSCQWRVKEHWRKRSQRYGEGSPIYVRSYVKGPEDKPFRAPRETVYRVKR